MPVIHTGEFEIDGSAGAEVVTTTFLVLVATFFAGLQAGAATSAAFASGATTGTGTGGTGTGATST